MTDRDPYEAVDAVLMPWARRHDIKVATLDRNYPVRSIWVYGRPADKRAQIWVDLPDSQGRVTVFAAEFVPSSPSKWGRREQRTVEISSLEAALEELRQIAFGWAGDGAFT